ACTVMAFEYLQDRNYIYRDLKPENMLIDSSGYLKLTDLGFAKHLADGKTYTTCGTLDYMAPEMLEKTGHNKAVDWWALGAVIYEMVSGLPPFYKSADNREKVLRIRKAKYKVPAFVSKECKDIVRRLLEPQALKRLGNTREGVSAIRSHPWFEDIDWEAMENRTHPVPYIPTTRTAAFQKWQPGYKHPAGPKFNRAPANENGAFDNF
ncbi:cGMP-dependent protein kinase, partial [Cymbomonas tetramitiformis]